MPKADAFPETFQTLKSILQRHGKRLRTVADTPTDYTLASPMLVDRIGRPLFVAAVQIKKTYVSYHLMPVYARPALLADVSPELRKRMQGKACFNFTSIEPAIARELSALTKAGFASLKDLELPWAR
jgi:hypothetical protein